jgi:phenylacetate-CoA ligase
MAEMALFAYQCPASTSFHFVPAVGHVETPNGDVNPFELIGTKRMTDLIPLRKFRTGDLASGYWCDICRDCGRRLQSVESIDGRKQDFLVASDGSRITSSMLNTHTAELGAIVHFQFRQHRVGQVEVKFMPRPFMSDIAEQQIRTYLEQTLPSTMQFTIAIVEKFERTSRGKIKLIDREINIEN